MLLVHVLYAYTMGLWAAAVMRMQTAERKILSAACKNSSHKRLPDSCVPISADRIDDVDLILNAFVFSRDGFPDGGDGVDERLCIFDRVNFL